MSDIKVITVQSALRFAQITLKFMRIMCSQILNKIDQFRSNIKLKFTIDDDKIEIGLGPMDIDRIYFWL